MTAADPNSDVTRGVPVGLVVRTPSRTITEGEVALLSNVTWSRGPLHTNQVAAEASAFGALSLPGPATLAVMAGLLSSSALSSRLERHGIVLLALLGTEGRYRQPVLVGDTIYVEVEVVAARASSSRAGCGVLTFEERATNQRDALVAEVVEHVMFSRTGR